MSYCKSIRLGDRFAHAARDALSHKEILTNRKIFPSSGEGDDARLLASLSGILKTECCFAFPINIDYPIHSDDMKNVLVKERIEELLAESLVPSFPFGAKKDLPVLRLFLQEYDKLWAEKMGEWKASDPNPPQKDFMQSRHRPLAARQKSSSHCTNRFKI